MIRNLACGFLFAVWQAAYFFLVEAFVSAQFYGYFFCLLFWLAGFLLGLNLDGRRFRSSLLAGSLAYYLALGLSRAYPFHLLSLAVVALCTACSGVAAGLFFAGLRGDLVRPALIQENNGFVLGLLAAALASLHFGEVFLAWFPLLGTVAVVLAEFRRPASSVSA